MPYVQMNTNSTLTATQKETLMQRAAAMITVIPSKTPERTMVQINDGVSMYFACNGEPCMKVLIELFHEAPYEAKQEYLQKLFALIQETAGIPQNRIYLTYQAHEEWGSGGDLRR